MSFSGRLNNTGSITSHQNSNNVVPLSISNKKTEEDKCSIPHVSTIFPNKISRKTEIIYTLFQILHTGGVLDEKQRQALVQDWLACKSQLMDQSRQMRQCKEDHEIQLVTLSRQLLELECGLRKRERELCSILQQRERVIREQAHIIQFLSQKSQQLQRGQPQKSTDIFSLASQAVSKIPQFDVENAIDTATRKTKNLKPKSQATAEVAVSQEATNEEANLTSILESESENDSAVIIDSDNLTATSGTSPNSVSRSVSDVMSSEASSEAEKSSPHSPFASPNYRGFLLRHGSYERYKIRSMRLQHMHHQMAGGDDAAESTSIRPKKETYSNQVLANATLPRNRKKSKTFMNLEAEAEAEKCTTVIVINGTASAANEAVAPSASVSPSVAGHAAGTGSVNNHRNVMKPRDVKNKSKSYKLNPKLPAKDNKFILQQSGSVYCSTLYGELSEDEHISFA